MNEIKSSPLKFLSNEVLLQKTLALVAEERKLTTSVLWHLYEIQRRRLYSEKGYASLFEYAVKALGYSEAAAGRRIAAMRLLADVPEIEPALKDGSVNLSTLSTIQSFIQRKEEPVSKAEKRELVFALQGKSRRECEKHLVALDPMAATPNEKERVVSPTQTEIRFIADDALMEKLKRIRELDAHVTHGASYSELFHRMADIAIKKLDPLSQGQSAQLKPARVETPGAMEGGARNLNESDQVQMTPPAELVCESRETSSASHAAQRHVGHPRYISASLKRAVWQRDGSQCSFVSSNGRRCSSRFGLEMDHKIPFSSGGNTTFSNLRLLCRAHNQQQAIVHVGPAIMQRYLVSIC